MKVWITKYALTEGILEAEAEVCTTDPPGRMISVKGNPTAYYHGKGRDWHTDKESAVNRACAMLNAKLRSLDKQRTRLLNLRF